MTKQEFANTLIEGIGRDFAQLLDDMNKQAEMIARKHVAELCEKHGVMLSAGEAESAVSGALAGLLIGPAVGHAVNAGGTVDQYVELVRALFEDTQTEHGEPN